ncbi:hypothetical protein ElyMa_000952700, partial [Elysia marginata]
KNLRTAISKRASIALSGHADFRDLIHRLILLALLKEKGEINKKFDVVVVVVVFFSSSSSSSSSSNNNSNSSSGSSIVVLHCSSIVFLVVVAGLVV